MGAVVTVLERPRVERSGGNEIEVLFREARRRRHRRWLMGSGLVVLVLALALVSVGIWLSRDTTAPLPRPLHRSTHSSAPATPPVAPASTGLDRPTALSVTKNGDLLIANQGTNQILRRLPDGTLQVVAGTGTAGYGGDGGPAAQAELNTPSGIAVAPDGTIYVADTVNNRVRAISPSGTISTFAGDGSSAIRNGQLKVGPSGVPAIDAALADPLSVAFGPQGQLYVADSAGIQVIPPDRLLTTLTPSGLDPLIFGTPGELLASAITVDPMGDIYVADFSPKELVELSPTGAVLHSWVAYVTDAGLATAPDGSILVADYGWFSVDRVADGQLTRIASFSLDSIPGITGAFRPSGVVVTSTGQIYADTNGANGGTDTPALGMIDTHGQFGVLATGANTYSQGS
jgi:sugar lactone lactonase YvrE